MRIGNYELAIANNTECSTGHVHMPHGETYSVLLGNHCHNRCEVELRIDAKLVGCWRLEPYQVVTLERGVNDTGRFTFYKVGTKEAKKIGSNSISKNDQGLVTASFFPEKFDALPVMHINNIKLRGFIAHEPNPWIKRSECISTCDSSLSAGVTGLSGKSYQEFVDVDSIVRDYSKQININLRLISKGKQNKDPRPLVSITSNPIPEPV